MKNSNTIDVLYDGNCTYLVRITRLLKQLDRRQRIHLTNIAERNFDARIFDKSMNELIANIHTQLPDGSWLNGVEAFRLLASIVGLGPLVLLTRLPLIQQCLNIGYRVIARRMLKTRCSGSRKSNAQTIVTTQIQSNSGMRSIS